MIIWIGKSALGAQERYRLGYRIAGETETPEQREERIRKNRDELRSRRAAITPEQRLAETERSSSRNSQQDSTIPRAEVPSFDDPVVVRKMTKFHESIKRTS